MPYLDHAATTPLHPDAAAAMRPWLAAVPANASAGHAAGRAAREAVEVAREQVAGALGADPLEVVWTSGGTEGDNLGVAGLAWAGREAGRDRIVTTAIEHHAVLETCEALADRHGFGLDVVAPGTDGVVDPEAVLARTDDRTAVVAVMAVNNELGTVQPLDVLGPALAERGVALHVDGVQAVGRLLPGWRAWHAASMATSAHKHRGPQGIGAWLVRRDVTVAARSHGGGQERGLRSGTLPTALCAGAGAAMALAESGRAADTERLADLVTRFRAVIADLDDVTPTVPLDRVAPGFCHLAIGGVDTDALLMALDAAGVAASAGSACASGANRRSHVLEAIGAAETGHLRVSMGAATTADDVEAGAATLVEVVTKLRAAGGGGF